MGNLTQILQKDSLTLFIFRFPQNQDVYSVSFDFSKWNPIMLQRKGNQTSNKLAIPLFAIQNFVDLPIWEVGFLNLEIGGWLTFHFLRDIYASPDHADGFW